MKLTLLIIPAFLLCAISGVAQQRITVNEVPDKVRDCNSSYSKSESN